MAHYGLQAHYFFGKSNFIEIQLCPSFTYYGGCFLDTTAELSHCDKDHMAQSRNYFLSSPFKKVCQPLVKNVGSAGHLGGSVG